MADLHSNSRSVMDVWRHPPHTDIDGLIKFIPISPVVGGIRLQNSMQTKDFPSEIPSSLVDAGKPLHRGSYLIKFAWI
ncbi:hypothetical protein TNCV_3954251 [Trichonephila clavipes]|nr:hypothetical protein TNCV_3954251 [Trichonephila clavipes]